MTWWPIEHRHSIACHPPLSSTVVLIVGCTLKSPETGLVVAFKLWPCLSPIHRNPNLLTLCWNPGNCIFKYLTKSFFSGARLLIFLPPFFLCGNFWALVKDPVASAMFKFRYGAYATGRPPTTPSSSHHNLSRSMKGRGGGWRVFPFNRLGFSVLATCPGRTGLPACTQWNAVWTLTLIRLCLFLFFAKKHSPAIRWRDRAVLSWLDSSFSVVGEHELQTFVIVFSSK